MADTAFHEAGFLQDWNALREYAPALGLSRAELAIIHAIRHFQEQPQYHFVIPSLTALARVAGYSRAYVRRVLRALLQPQYHQQRCLRPAYLSLVYRAKKVWYDLRRLYRLVNERFLAAHPQTQPRQTPHPLWPLLERVFAGWGEVDGAPMQSLKRLDAARARAAWSDREIETVIALCADAATRARPQRHIALFLDLIEKRAAEDARRRQEQARLIALIQANEAYWRRIDQQRARARRREAQSWLPKQKSAALADMGDERPEQATVPSRTPAEMTPAPAPSTQPTGQEMQSYHDLIERVRRLERAKNPAVRGNYYRRLKAQLQELQQLFGKGENHAGAYT
jgi:AraC-like DNA-binding protein